MGYTAKAVEDTPLPPDPTGNHSNLMAAFHSLLPNCSKLSSLLDGCRERVASNPAGGSCLEDSRKWMACFNQRSKCSRAIVESCGGEDYTSHSELQKEYVRCMRKYGTKSVSIAEQNRCLEPIKRFLACATSVVEGT
jgi:hypothetical protein